jgi:hypothetical protein
MFLPISTKTKGLVVGGNTSFSHDLLVIVGLIKGRSIFFKAL